MKFALKFSIIYSLLLAVSSQLGGSTYYYEYRRNSGNLRPIAFPTTTQRYQNNIFLNNKESGGNFDQNDGTTFSNSLPSCQSFSAIRGSGFESTWGELSIPAYDVSTSIIRVVLSIAARLPTVREFDLLSNHLKKRV
jgi:hypothetical protein